MHAQGVVPSFKALWSPWSNYLCLAFVVCILGILLMHEDIRVSVLVIPFWLLLIWGFYHLRLRLGSAPETSG